MLRILKIQWCRIGHKFPYVIHYFDNDYVYDTSSVEYVTKKLKIKHTKYEDILKKYHARYDKRVGYYFEDFEDARSCLNYLNEVYVIALKLLD